MKSNDLRRVRKGVGTRKVRARTRKPPRKKPPPCMSCGEPRVWCAGQYADGGYEAVCPECVELPPEGES